MDKNNDLLLNLDKLHTTEMGAERIVKNLKLSGKSAEYAMEYCKKIISDKSCNIYRQGKNLYCELNGIKITVNANSFTVITARTIK